MSRTVDGSSLTGLYPNCYSWFVCLAMLDVACTWAILQLGGREANVFAAGVIDAAGLPGMIGLKALTVGVVLAACEFVGRHRLAAGRRLAFGAVALTAFPVGVAGLFFADFFVTLLNL